IIMSFAVLSTFTACSEEELMYFGDEHHIYFEKFYKDAAAPGKERADSTNVSFFFYPDDVKELDAKVVVNMTGRLLEKDETFKLKVVPEMTTATADEYELKDTYVFRAHNVSESATNQSDTIAIRMFKSDRLKDLPRGIKLTVELVPMGGTQLGQTERTRAVIVLTKDAPKPEWWDTNVTHNLFGEFTNRKYKLFLTHIDPGATLNAEMLKEHTWKAIELVRKFKEWLAQHPNEAVEEDGSPITVNV
ncbi:MAG TPA: DUF4843 domain-containing protein, partial [Prevotella sp.]